MRSVTAHHSTHPACLDGGAVVSCQETTPSSGTQHTPVQRIWRSQDLVRSCDLVEDLTRSCERQALAFPDAGDGIEPASGEAAAFFQCEASCPDRIGDFVLICHPGGSPAANLKSISHRCHLFEVAFVWELTKETIDLPLGCLQGG